MLTDPGLSNNQVMAIEFQCRSLALELARCNDEAQFVAAAERFASNGEMVHPLRTADGCEIGIGMGAAFSYGATVLAAVMDTRG